MNSLSTHSGHNAAKLLAFRDMTMFGTRVLVAVALVLAPLTARTADPKSIRGAGATFPTPLYAKWAAAYGAKTGVKIEYQSVGSGAGIEKIKAKEVDFGASDMPLPPELLQKENLFQFPTVIGGNVPVVNLPGIQRAQLRFTGPVLADIYLGKITKWNDPVLVALNKNVPLPEMPIQVVHRSDGSGTTFIWVNYLSKVSQEWKTKIGEGITVAWPIGTGAKGNEGVSALVASTPGAIGYVEYAHAVENKLSDAQVQNQYGNFVSAGTESFRAAAAYAEWARTKNFALVLTNQPGRNAWPISGATYILMHKTQADPERAKEVLRFFAFAYGEGDKSAIALNYVPLPAAVIWSVESAWISEVKDRKGDAIWK